MIEKALENVAAKDQERLGAIYDEIRNMGTHETAQLIDRLRRSNEMLRERIAENERETMRNWSSPE